MPTNRDSIETVEIGRGNGYYEPRTSHPRPVRRSSTLRSDEWDSYDRSTRNGRVRYDESRPRYEEVDIYYDRPSRPVSFYNDRGQDNTGPVERYDELERKFEASRRQLEALRLSAPSTALSKIDAELYEIARAERELEDLREKERRIIAERSRRVSSRPDPPVEYLSAANLRDGPPHIPGLFQTVFDVNHPQDASVHLELPITEDHETELEGFCRLQRLGNFGAAEEYFKEHLEPYLSNPYVFVQYGQMLLEKGDYLAFERLNAEAVFGKEESPPSRPREKVVVIGNRSRSRARSQSWSRSRERRRATKPRTRSPSPIQSFRRERRTRFDSDERIVIRRSRSPERARERARSLDSARDYYERDRDNESDRSQSPDRGAQSRDSRAELEFDELELLRQNWKLMEAICNIYSKKDYQYAINEAWTTIEEFRFGTSIGSTEIQLVKLTLQICAYVGRKHNERHHNYFREAARDWIEWPTLFKELLSQGRIWDFKDLYVANLAAFSNSGATPYLGTESTKRSLIDDWISEEGDESTNLALLDILLEPSQLRSAFPDDMKSRAKAIIAHCPAAMRSRSFIRWILASAADALNGEKKGEDDLWKAYKTHIQGFPGMVWHSHDCFLLGIYVPRDTENPGWVAPDISLAVNEPVQLALNLAKELKDYKSQVACLKLLIFQSPDPTQLFQELASLQKSVQGDKKGHLKTLLSSYLVCKDRPAKEKLLEELQQTDDWRDDMISGDGLIYWTRDFIERALKRSLQGPKPTAKLRNPAGFYIGQGLSWEAEEFTRQNAELGSLPHTATYSTYRHIRHEPAPSSQPPPRVHERRIVKPYSGPSSPSRRDFLRPELRPQSAPRLRDDESYSRREREEVERLREMERLRKELQMIKEREELIKEREDHEERLRKELQLRKEKDDRQKRNQQDQEMRKRLEEAELRWRHQEEINKRQTQEMIKKTADMEQLKQDLKLTKEKHDQETRAQQDRETRERLERAELSLRDQAERLRRAEDRPYQEWLAGKYERHRENTRYRRTRIRRKTSDESLSQESSDSYRSDDPPSSDDEDYNDDSPFRRIMRRYKVTSSDSEGRTDHEVRATRRRRGSVEELRSKPRGDEADHRDGDDVGNVQQNPCTDLVLYSEAQVTTSPSANIAESSIPGLSTSPHIRGEVTGLEQQEAYIDEDQGEDRSISEYEQWQSGDLEYGRLFFGPDVGTRPIVGRNLEDTNLATNDDEDTEAGSDSPSAIPPQRLEERDNLYEPAGSVGVDEGETPAQRKARRKNEHHDRLMSRFSPHERRSRSPSGISTRPLNVENASGDGNATPAELERGRLDITVEDPQKDSQEEQTDQQTDQQTEHLTAEPQAVDHPEQAGPDATRNSGEVSGRDRPQRSQSRRRDKLQSKQNERIANRPSRPASMGGYGSPRASMYESTGVSDAWEDSKRKRADRRIIIDPSPSTASASRASKRVRSRPLSMQDLDDIRPLGRRSSWRDNSTVPSPGERLLSPTKRQSLIIDADGRPQPTRTTSENRRSYAGDAGSGTYIRARRGCSADGRRSMPEMPRKVAESGLRPQSTGGVSSRQNPPGPESGVPEKRLAGSWERETEGVWRKKKTVSTVPEDPEEDDERELSAPKPQTNEEQSSSSQGPPDPEQGISRKSTVTDPETNDE